jgi:DNA-binding NtrC family response regulator
VRVLAATNRDLPAMVRQGLFREDLYYRLRTIAIEIPSLRQRQEDIALLADYFVRRFNERFGFQKRIGAATLDALSRHDWPGNVRELLHVVEAAMVVCEGPEILPEHLPAGIRNAATAPPAVNPSLPTLEALERAHIERALRETGGHRSQTARVLGISERNLYRKLKDYGLLT